MAVKMSSPFLPATDKKIRVLQKKSRIMQRPENVELNSLRAQLRICRRRITRVNMVHNTEIKKIKKLNINKQNRSARFFRDTLKIEKLRSSEISKRCSDTKINLEKEKKSIEQQITSGGYSSRTSDTNDSSTSDKTDSPDNESNTKTMSKSLYNESKSPDTQYSKNGFVIYRPKSGFVKSGRYTYWYYEFNNRFYRVIQNITEIKILTSKIGRKTALYNGQGKYLPPINNKIKIPIHVRTELTRRMKEQVKRYKK